MKRIVNGDPTDPESTRDIIDISMSHWELFSAELLVAKKQATELKDVDVDEYVREITVLLDSMDNLELILPPDMTLDDIKKQFDHPQFGEQLIQMQHDTIAMVDNLSQKAKLMPNGEWGIIGIVPFEYMSLIYALQQNLNAHTGAVNNADNGKVSDIATEINKKLFKGDDVFDDHPLMQNLPEGKSKRDAKLEMANTMMPIVYSWMEALNQPYEGVEY
jgi:hypothetical protein